MRNGVQLQMKYYCRDIYDTINWIFYNNFTGQYSVHCVCTAIAYWI